MLTKPGAITAEKAASGKVNANEIPCPSYTLGYNFHTTHSPIGPASKVRRF